MVQASCSSGDYVLWRLGGDGAASRLLPQIPDEQFVLDYSADGKRVFAEQADGQRTQLINPTTGSVKHLQGIFGPTRTSDPSEVFVASEDGTGGRYDIESGEPVGPPVEFEFEVWGWTVTGHRTIVRGGEGDGDDFRAHLVAVDADGRVVFDLEQEHASRARRRPTTTISSRRTATASSARSSVVIPPGALVGELVGHGDAGFGRVVGGGGVLVAVADDGQVLVLDPDTLLPAGGPLPGISVSADVLTLSADGRRLLLVGDRSIRFYDIASRTQLGDAIPIGRESGGALRPDGLEAAVGTDHGIVVWDLDPEHWVDGACAIAGRNLTRAEWDQYIGDLASYRTTCPEYEPAE